MSLFADPSNYPYRAGGLFLGLNDQGSEVGITTERHAITIAGAGAGKGACLLIPNALRWPHNLLVVDPKGEVAAASWQAREALGQSVHVLDPFKVADVPDRLRASFNPLSAIDPESPTGREDIEAIADGLIKRSDPKHEEWYDGAASLLAGLMAYTIECAPPDFRNLAGVRELLNQEDEALNVDAQKMLDTRAFGRLAREAGLTILTALKSEKGMEKDFLGAAKRYTKWMDSPPIAAALTSSSFNLSDLKTGAASVFLVLPPQYIDTHAAFLRMFVRGGITAMMQDGAKVKKRCLLMMDEFFTLGKLEIVAKSAGLMRGYGLHLWPFLQDLGQLQTLYGEKLAETFFGNADAHIFFGNTDSITLNYVSNQLGQFETSEVNAPPAKQAFKPKFWSNHKTLDGELTGDGKIAKDEWDSKQETLHRQHQYAMSRVGKNRIPPDKVRSIVSKKDGDVVAQSMIVVAKGSDILNVRLAPYFQNSTSRVTSFAALALGPDAARKATGIQALLFNPSKTQLVSAGIGLIFAAFTAKDAPEDKVLDHFMFLVLIFFVFGSAIQMKSNHMRDSKFTGNRKHPPLSELAREIFKLWLFILGGMGCALILISMNGDGEAKQPIFGLLLFGFLGWCIGEGVLWAKRRYGRR